MELQQRKFRADPLKLKRLRVAAGLTVQEVTERSGLDKATVRKLLNGEPVFLNSLKLAIETVFGIESPLEVLHPEELAAMGATTETPGRVLEWDVAEHLSGWKETSNGLQYQETRLTHAYLPNREARGKCYELRHLADAGRERLETHLRRHPDFCERVGAHPNVAENLTAAELAGQWWVLDRWVAGATLAGRIESEGPLGEYALRRVVTGVAEGLAALHAAGVVRRELSAEKVLLRESDDLAVLVDLELAKLTEGEPTVAPEEWPDDPFRAPEVGGDAPLDERADLYSWGKLLLYAAFGEQALASLEGLSRDDLPPEVAKVALACVAPGRSQRPPGIEAVLGALRAWR